MTDYENHNPNEYTGEPNPYPSNGPYGNDPYGVPPEQPKPKKQKNGFATAALACGVCAVLDLCCFTFPLAVIMGMAAIAFAIVSKKGQPMTGTAIAGTMLGVLAVALGIAEFCTFLYLYDLMRKPELIPYFNEWFRQVEQMLVEQGRILP